MTTRLDMRHVRIDTYSPNIDGEFTVAMTNLVYGWRAEASAPSRWEARVRCIEALEFRNDFECLRQGKRRLAQVPFWEYTTER